MRALSAELGGFEFPHERINSLLPHYWKELTPLQDKIGYLIEARDGDQGFEGQHFCWETHLGMRLLVPTKAGMKPGAGVGFFVTKERLFVRQLQGFRNRRDSL